MCFWFFVYSGVDDFVDEPSFHEIRVTSRAQLNMKRRRALTHLDVGVGVATTANSASQQDTSGFLQGIAGLHISAIEPIAKANAWKFVKALPLIGTAIAVNSTGHDLGEAIVDYIVCLGEN